MGRANCISQSEYPYFITARCINREWFNLPMEKVWEIFEEELYLASLLHNLKIHGFVLMSNHFHLIASTPDANISQCTHRFMGNVSRRLNEVGNRENQTFGGRHFKTVLSHPNYFLAAYKYLYRNPVKAGVCKMVEEYPFSSLQGLIGLRKVLIPLEPDETLFDNLEEGLRWLNTPPDAMKEEAVRYALKRATFESKKCRVTNKPIFTEDDAL